MGEEKKRNYPRKIARIFLKIVLFLFLFIVLVFILVLTPPVQRFMTGKAETFLQKKLKTRVEIGSISFGLSGRVVLQDIYIEDKTKDTLVSGGSIKSHISFLKLFSNEVQIKDIELQNITAKIKRILPDTLFNYQFIIDAFTSEQKKDPDTAQTAPMKLNISDVALDNVRLTYVDAVTGNDMFARIGNLSATIDTLNPYTMHVDIPSIIARNVQVRVKQTKPLIQPEPLSKDMADAAKPVAMKLNLGTIELSKFNVQLDNDVSAFYTTLNLGQFKANSKLIDLQHNKIYLDQVVLNNSKSVIRLGKKETEKLIEKEISQEIAAQKTQAWDFRVDKFQIDNNSVKFDNDNQPRLAHGMDYAHISANNLTLHVEDLVFNTDTIGASVTQGSMKEKSGFDLQQLRGNLLYANNQSYLKDLYIKTPGTEIKRNLVLEYASFEALTKNFAETVFNLELVDSKVQVKDILVFAPQLRSNPALANPNDIWNLNIIGSGTMNRLYFETLQFAGLRNTRIDAQGTLVGLMKPTQAGGNFTIRKFHTSQTDIALFTGQRLSNAQMNLPETFDISGTVNGNAGKLNTNLNLNTSAGFIALNGIFSNLTSPTSASYNATIRTNGLQLGSILRKPDQVGSLSANFTVNGRGLTPTTINTKFKGVVNSLGYNQYQYRNVKLNGSLVKTAFSVNADVNDPNIAVNLTASGDYAAKAFKIDGMVDSIKTLPLHFTTQPVIFRGQINGTVKNVNPDYLDANVLITKALLVAGNERLPLDTVRLVSGRSDTANFIRFNSDIVNAQITGQYRFSDLGNIVQSTIQPYFSVTPASKTANVKPYNFRFTADAVYSPVLTAFVPSLTAMEPLHAEGTFSNNEGMRAVLSTSSISFAGNRMSDLSLRANTSDSGLQISANMARLISGSSFDLYNTRINATALNNAINFNLGIDDASAKNRYNVSGIINQPSPGAYAIRLKPDNLLLNYETWTVTQDNLISIGTTSITANNFVLQKGEQRLSIISLDGSGPPLQVSFTDFRLATLTGFVKADSSLADGVLNGNITFQNLAQQPVFTSNLTINDLSLKQDTIGNVNVQVNTTGNNRYNANATITGRGNDVVLSGSFAPAGNDIDLDLNLAVRQLQLNTIAGALKPAITDPTGIIKGTVKIRGKASKPSIQGDMNFNQSSFILTMLGSRFTIDNEKLSVTENGITFDNFAIRDSANNALNIDGSVLSSNFINYNFNLRIRARNFLAMNSTKEQSKLYYGRLNINTDVRINGTESKPVVDGSLTVNEGTNLVVVVPQAEPGVQQREGVVQFVDMKAPENDSLFLASITDSLNKTSILGMDIAINIEVKKEAVLNVVVDEANGDFLNVQGEAVISTGIDPSGKITMVGTYTLESGSYQISFNFLKRKFDIEKGSTITWTGEPTAAQLNVTAIYLAHTSPMELVQSQIASSTIAIKNTYLQKLPFEVHLRLTGELLRPIVGFDIVLPENKNYGVSNDIVTLVQGRLSQLRQDEGDINKQVFSLLLLGRFVGDNPFESAGSAFSAETYARQSVSRLLTEQLNVLGANLIQGVDINFDLQSTDDYTTGERRNRTDLNVGVSKRLLNDRLKVMVGSNFELEGPQNTNEQSNNVAGNIALDYQLTKDGRYLVRFFRRNQYEGIVDGHIIENGISFMLSVDYNRFMEILKGRRQRVTHTDSTNQNTRR